MLHPIPFLLKINRAETPSESQPFPVIRPPVSIPLTAHADTPI